MSPQFDRLSDCVLLFLLEHLDSTSLYQLSQVTPRFEQLILEKSLWKRIDARDEPNDKKKINYILDRVHNLTEMLLLRGKIVYPRVVEIIQSGAFKKLTILSLENQTISQHNGVKLSDFPHSLVELSLRNSSFEASSEFFKKGFEAMENLKVLIVDGCTNVSSSVIMSVSKYPNLEIFSCYKCPIENSVAYFSIAVANGFKKIKVFDVRLSGLGNTFLRAMMRKPNVLAIYFQNKDTSYELDFRNRAAEVTRLNLQVPKVQFNKLSLTGNEENLISDFGTLEFTRTIADFEDLQLPDSFLYSYPYPPCNCGFKDRQEKCKLGLGLISDETESMNPTIYVREDERKLIEIIDSGEKLDHVEEIGNKNENSERGNNIANGRTEIGQICESNQYQNQRTSRGASPSSDSDANSLSDAEETNHPRICTEIIYRIFSRRKLMRDQAVGTDLRNDCRINTTTNANSSNASDRSVSNDVCRNSNRHNQPSTSNLLPLRNDNIINITDVDSNNVSERPVNSDVGCNLNRQDQPSTSGLSMPLKKRKLSSIVDKDWKKAKIDHLSSDSSSSDEDENTRKKISNNKTSLHCPLQSSKSFEGCKKKYGAGENSDENVLCDSKGSDESTQKSLNRNTDRLNHESGANNSPEGDRRRGVVVRSSRGVRDVPTTRTQVYPCACGNHSVIVVLADETEEGDVPLIDPHLSPPENLFRPMHCEQRINLNFHQSLRVINRNENANARPEIELVERNKDKSLKCGLKQLSFRGYGRVSNMTLKNVADLHLDLLDVTYTKCTKKGILDFLRTNPNCRVLHKEFCVCRPKMDF